MPLLPGTRLGAYEVVAPLGAGGMGEVYKARDTRLGRFVAIKALPDLFAANPERIARFQREAQVLATLNHPHIAAIHGLEEIDARRFLVLEFVEGESLAALIARHGHSAPAAATPSESAPAAGAGVGPRANQVTSRGVAARGGGAPRAMNIDDALSFARQILDALEAAHEKGIIHRDLKPANIMVTPDGTVKVLDFGLARVVEADSSPDSAHSPTLTAMATQMGVILGTAAYMSPEQAKGRVADRRSDVWAFGCVLYEMLTGARAFEGEDVSDTLAFVLTKEPDWSRLPATVPPGVLALLKRCLVRERKARIPEISTVRFLLEDALSAPVATATALGTGGSALGTGHSALGSRASRPRRFWLAVSAALALGAGLTAAGAWALARWTPAPKLQVMRLAIVPPATSTVSATAFDRALVFSPDGTHVVYATGTGPLMVRAIDQLEATPLLGTEGARIPFVSPDSKWVGYFHGTSELRKIAMAGGPPTVLCKTSNGPRGGTWAPNDTIIFATNAPQTGLLSVSAAGGEPKALTTPDTARGEADHLFPEMLPDGRAVLFTVAVQGAIENAQVAVLDLKTGQSKILIRGGSQGQYIDSPGGGPGYLVYAAAGTLRAIRFDTSRLETIGDSVAVLDRVSMVSSGASEFNMARTGALAYLPGKFNSEGAFFLAWVDRQGRESPIPAPPRTYVNVRLSPDGNRIALDIRDQEQDVWIWDLTRRTLSRLTFGPALDAYPVWTPDGKRVVFASRRHGPFSLFSQAADGTGTAEPLTAAAAFDQSPFSFSPDGKRLVIREAPGKTGDDVSLLSLEGKPASTPLLHGSYDERNGEISPDGRWMAYESNESSRSEVYVRPFPNVDSGGRWQISTAGGSMPVWARNGRELFYVSADRFLWVVPVQTSAGFAAGNATKLFEARNVAAVTVARFYDVSPDGQRFVMIKQANQNSNEPAPNIVVVLNWVEELKAKFGR